MLLIRSRLMLILTIIGGFICLPAASWAQDLPSQEPATEAVPAELAEVPAGQAVVTYQNDELMIKARNAPLIDVLRAVCSRIGAEFDSPLDPREPILGILGPGPMREVLDSLLNGSHFNYVMQASDSDPKILARIIISPRDDTRHKVAQGPASQPQVSQPEISLTPDAPISQGMNQLRDLLAQAKAEVAHGIDGDAGVADGGDVANVADVLQQLEAQIKVAAAAKPTDSDTKSPPAGQQARISGSDAANADPSSTLPPGRHRHRRHH